MIGRIAAFVLVLAACGGSAAVTDTAPEAETPSSPVADPTAQGEDGAAVAPAEARQRPDGPAAPDFTLALGQGGEFSLSGEQKPVYMVFWAEW
jgi:hypothetical protein